MLPKEAAKVAVDYLDFDLLVTRAAASGGRRKYRAQVVSSPAGQAASEFRLPFSNLELDNFVLRVGRTRSGVRRLDSPEMAAAKGLGERLFNAVFAGEVRACLARSLDEVTRQGAGLRIRLRLTGAPEVGEVPWEYLYDPTQNRFLALSVATPLVRYLDLPEAVRPVAVQSPLRMLVMVSNPNDHPRLDVEQEWAKLREALSELEQREKVIVERLPDATLATLQGAIQRSQYNILHFIGHGGFDQTAQDGMLLLEDQGRRGHAVRGEQLGWLLHNHRPLRLAVLNACEGARTSRTDPFGGVAQCLVQQGIPAVIAMQFEISDAAAITFARSFYGAVADNYPVDAALAWARLAIIGQGNDVEWGTPVLYMRSPTGQIFEPAEAGRTPLTDDAPAVDGQARLADLQKQADASLELGRWDEAIELFREIVSLRPNDPVAADNLEEATRQQRLAQGYANGVRASGSGAWAEAVECFAAVLAGDRDYRDAADRLTEARRQRVLAELYAEARRRHAAGRWQGVLDALEQIQARDPTYPDPENLLDSARQGMATEQGEQELAALYRRGTQHLAQGEWSDAVQAFERLQESRPSYHDAERLLARAKSKAAEAAQEAERQEELAGLYAEACRLDEAGDWQAVLDLVGRIQEVDPSYPDSEALAESARQRRTAQERDAKVAGLKSEAGSHVLGGRWTNAVPLLEEVVKIQPDDRDAQDLLAQARGEVERQAHLADLLEKADQAFDQAEWATAASRLQAILTVAPDHPEATARLSQVRRQQKLADLYAEALRRHEAGHWQGVVETFDQICDLDPIYRDPQHLRTSAEKALESDERRERMLAAVYSKAVDHLDRGNWSEAVGALRNLEHAGYRDAGTLLTRATREARASEDASWRRWETMVSLGREADDAFNRKDWATAAARLEAVLKVAPGHAEATARLELIRRQEALAQREERGGARSLWKMPTLWWVAVIGVVGVLLGLVTLQLALDLK